MSLRASHRMSLVARAPAVLALLAVGGAALATAGRAADVGGVAIVPGDAAFVSATLRLREQFERFTKSNAYAALRKLPAVARAMESIEDQKLQPGSPLSIMATFMELPENQQALELLDDMISTDTFVYGEPSCVTFMELVKKLQRARNAAGILDLASGSASVAGFEVDVLEGIEMREDDDGKDDGAATERRLRVQPVRLQAAEAAERMSSEQLAARLMLKTLAENVDSIVVPDIVWGFKIGKREAATAQLKRVEVLVKLVTQANPDLADSLERRKIAGGEVVTFTVEPDVNLIRAAVPGVEGEDEATSKVLDRIAGLKLVIGLGVIGDRVVLSLGDSIDHLEKLALEGSGRQGLLATKAFEPLLAHQSANKDNALTGINYLSEPMARAVAQSAEDIEELAELSDMIADLADLPDGAADEARRSLGKVAEGYRRRLPVPGTWLSFSFLTGQGYEGYVWDWSKNLPFDGSKRLDLLEHTGGAPLAAAAFRVKNDPGQFEDFASWADMGWSFFRTYVLPKADAEDREKIEEIDEQMAPIGRSFVEILRKKILPALADGQMAFVIDGKSSTKRPHAGLPASADPLPLVEPAIVLGLDDPQLFKEGMNDLFELADKLVDAVRELNPDAVPADYQVPEPVKTKLEAGSLWSFPLSGGIDEKIQPTIGVSQDAAVLALVPKQVGRLLPKSRLETGSQLSKFEEPLIGAKTVDVAGLVDAIMPWAVYLTRYGCAQQRDGSVDPGAELGPDDENPQAKDALAQARIVAEAIKSLRVAVAETAAQDGAMVTHWRNVIRDMPAK